MHEESAPVLADYLKIGFIEAPHDCRFPMCLLCHQTFSNEAMKYGRILQHLSAKYKDKSTKPLAYFEDLRQKFSTDRVCSNASQNKRRNKTSHR